MKRLATACASVLFIAASSSIVKASDNPPIEKALSLDDVSLTYTETGSGDTIIAIHGAVSDSRVWDAYQQPLSKDHHFVTYTRRYYGTAPWPSGEKVYDATVHAEDLATLIRSTGESPVHLLARSSGGYAAVITAVKHPELVRSLVLWEPFVGNDFVASAGFDEKSLEMIGSFRKGFGAAAKAAKSGDMNAAVEHFVEHVYEMDAGAFTGIDTPLKNMFYDNARTLSLLFKGKTTDQVTCEFLGKVQAPTLVLRGGDTDAGYALTHIKAAECIPGSELAVIEGVVHNGSSKKPAEVSQHALNFWSTLK